MARCYDRRPVLAYAQVAVAAVAWGTWSLFLRPAGVDARWSATIMMGVVGVATLPLLLRQSSRGPTEGPPRAAREWWAIALLGLFDAGNAVLFFAAMETTTIAVAVLSHYLAPVFIAAAAPWVLRTPRRRGAVVLSLLALLGLAIVLEPWRLGEAAGASAGRPLGRPLLGAALGAGSAVFYAANVFITKRLGPRFTAEEQLSIHALLSALLLLAVALAVRAPLPTGGGALRVGVAGALVGATAGLLFLRGLKRIPAEHASMLCFLEPLTAVLIAWAAWGERPSPGAVLGFVLVIGAGVIAVGRSATAPA